MELAGGCCTRREFGNWLRLCISAELSYCYSAFLGYGPLEEAAPQIKEADEDGEEGRARLAAIQWNLRAAVALGGSSELGCGCALI